jgi:hypothetical protein
MKLFAVSLFLATVLVGPPLESSSSPNCISKSDISLVEIAEKVEVCLDSNPDVGLVDGLVMELPDPGTSVVAIKLDSNGNEATIAVGRTLDGDAGAYIDGVTFGASIYSVTTYSNQIQSLASTPTKCMNQSYALAPFHLAGSYNWYYNPTGQPSTLADALVSTGISTWKSGTNLCTGYSYSYAISYSKVASSSTEPNAVTSTGTCGTFNNHNSIGWGALPTGTLGVTCTKYSNSLVVESDTKFSTSAAWFISAGTSCTGSKADFQGVVTHEFGHTLGLAHALQTSDQTMKPNAGDCDLLMRKLGWGDQVGASVNY